MKKAWYHVPTEEDNHHCFLKCFMKNRLIGDAISQWGCCFLLFFFWYGEVYGVGIKDKLNATCKNIDSYLKLCLLFLVCCILQRTRYRTPTLGSGTYMQTDHRETRKAKCLPVTQSTQKCRLPSNGVHQEAPVDVLVPFCCLSACSKGHHYTQSQSPYTTTTRGNTK